MTMRIIRSSVLRLNGASPTIGQDIENEIAIAVKLATPILEESRKEDWLYYDFSLNFTIEQNIRAGVLDSEIHLCEVDGEIAGFMKFSNIIVGKCANIEIYISPKYRKAGVLKEFCERMEQYVFTPFPEGLGVIKLKCFVHPENKASLAACKCTGFRTAAFLPFEGLFKGTWHPMIYLELYPPSVRDEVRNGQQQSESAEATKLHPDSTLCTGTEHERAPRVRKQRATGELPINKPTRTKHVRNGTVSSRKPEHK